MLSYRKSFTAAALLVTALLPRAYASSIDAIYAFGDSLSDAGNIYAGTGGTIPGPPNSNGRFTNGNVWVQDVANSLGLGPLTPSLLGGNDFAYGSAETGTTPVHTVSPLGLDLLGSNGQIARFSALHAVADPNALYTIWIGSNDLSDILQNANPTQYAVDAAAVVANIDKAVSLLAADGAKNFLVLTVPDLGKTPGVTAGGPLAVAAASGLSLAFDNALVNGEAGVLPSLGTLASSDGVKISVVDTFSLIDAAVADPALYGFSNVTSPCVTGENASYNGGTACASTMAGQDQYLFWDTEHPTAAGHQLVAGAALATIPEPSTILLLTAGLVGVFVARKRKSVC